MTIIDVPIPDLETQLNDFDPNVRSNALAALNTLAKQGAVELNPVSEVANMHCHTFFSFNAFGYSPTALAWLARQHGFKLMGIVDFDVLDGVDEFLDACDVVDVRGSAGVETRVFIPEFAQDVINSPGEPGIAYHMGIGFTSSHVPDSVSGIASAMRQRAAARNQSILQRVNEHLAPVEIDYTGDVLPLAPGGTPTERHLVAAYIQAAEKTVEDLPAFWTNKLGTDAGEIETLMEDRAAFQNLIRSRLMKRGGVGYVQAGPESFPTVEEFHKLILACGALPCAAWLDGTSVGEQKIEQLLELLINKGVVALNIVPDRNWNIADPKVRQIKIRNLMHIVCLSEELALPLNIGTEMNSFGQKLIDDLDAPELGPVRDAFMEGAYFIYGHTVFQRGLGLGYQSEWAMRFLPSRRERNEFFTTIGHRIPPGESGMAGLRQLETTNPAAIIDQLG